MNHRKGFFLGLLTILATFVIAQPALTEPILELPETLEQHAGGWQAAVAELENRGMIAEGGQLIFEEDSAYFAGQGQFFTNLARHQPRADFVMAGELTFTKSEADEVERCALLSRIVMHPTENYADRFLMVGLTNKNQAYYRDQYGSRSEDYYGATFRRNVDLSAPHHFLLLAIDDTLTVYFDGELELENVTIDDRSGSYGIALGGNGPTARCEGSNIWVYEVPVVEEGVCEITSNGTVNRRDGPGTSYGWVGTLSSETVIEAVAQATDDDGFIWWQLADNSWVREDVVNARGGCHTLLEPGEVQTVEATEVAYSSPETTIGNAVGGQATEPQSEEAPATDEQVAAAGEETSLTERIEQLNSGDFNCTVRTDQLQFASVRVGPGSNRTAILFLPASRDFRVIGQAAATADNGQLWWKLDKEEVAPDTSAAELWVAQNQVEASGDCELVPFVEAPPLIQIVTAANVLPQSGTWMIDGGTAIVTCPSGIVTFTVNTPPQPVAIAVAADGSSLMIGSDNLQRTQTGVYVGNYSTVIEGESLYMTFTARVVAVNRIETESNSTFYGCSIVVYNTITR